LTDLVSSGRNKNEEENSFVHEYELKGLAFRAERFVLLDSILANSLVTIFMCSHFLFFAYKSICELLLLLFDLLIFWFITLCTLAAIKA
jgi:hypothetical protein